jgi:hypothetical protein
MRSLPKKPLTIKRSPEYRDGLGPLGKSKVNMHGMPLVARYPGNHPAHEYWREHPKPIVKHFLVNLELVSAVHGCNEFSPLFGFAFAFSINIHNVIPFFKTPGVVGRRGVILHQTFFPEAEKPFPGNDQMIVHQDIKELCALLDRLGQPDVGV